jgi:predicted DNA-binding transcriptional regulator AlpA
MTLSRTEELALALAKHILAQPRTPKKFHDSHVAEQIDALLRENQSETSQATAGPVRNRGPPEEPRAYTVDEFCHLFRISRSGIYALWRAGRGPRVFRFGRATRISADAALEWVAQREAEIVEAEVA